MNDTVSHIYHLTGILELPIHQHPETSYRRSVGLVGEVQSSWVHVRSNNKFVRLFLQPLHNSVRDLNLPFQFPLPIPSSIIPVYDSFHTLHKQYSVSDYNPRLTDLLRCCRFIFVTFLVLFENNHTLKQDTSPYNAL